MGTGGLWFWFNLFVAIMLVLDLGVFHRRSKEIKVKEALIWTAVWIGLALIFNGWVYIYHGKEKGLEFLTGYLIEKSLSIDNIFVIILIFSYFKVPPQYQHKVLFWGIMGALVMRAIFIFAGISLLHRFHWIIYIFAGLLIYTGVRMLVQKEKEINPESSFVVRIYRRLFKVTPQYHGNKFFVRIQKQTFATPLFLVVLMVEASDLIFAVDSIPAVLGVSTDEFIVYTSNVFAILGLRSLYFALAHMHSYFAYLKVGLSLILIFVGVKMCIAEFYKIPTYIALLVIVLILGLAILYSVLHPTIVRKRKKRFT